MAMPVVPAEIVVVDPPLGDDEVVTDLAGRVAGEHLSGHGELVERGAFEVGGDGPVVEVRRHVPRAQRNHLARRTVLLVRKRHGLLRGQLAVGPWWPRRLLLHDPWDVQRIPGLLASRIRWRVSRQWQ